MQNLIEFAMEIGVIMGAMKHILLNFWNMISIKKKIIFNLFFVFFLFIQFLRHDTIVDHGRTHVLFREIGGGGALGLVWEYYVKTNCWI